MTLQHKPGAARHYSNVGYGLIEMAMMNVSKQSFSTLMQQRLFDPLGMSHSYVLSDADEADTDAMVRGYHCQERCEAIDDLDWEALGSAANGIAASSHDLSLFLTAMLKKRRQRS